MGVGRPKDVGAVGEEGVECEDFEEECKGWGLKSRIFFLRVLRFIQARVQWDFRYELCR